MSVTSGQEILLPERDRRKVQRQTTVVVNSRDRRVTSYPNSSTFRFLLRRPLKEILSVELVNGCIPGLIYNINDGWNRFTFREAADNYNLTIPPGFYDPTSLAAQLQLLLNSSSLTNTYTCTASLITQRLTITRTVGTETFGLLFYSGTFTDDLAIGANNPSVNCPASFLGFGYSDYSDVSGTIISPMAMDTENFLNRVYLYINAESTIDLHRMELGAGGKDCFHIFYFSPGKENYIFLNKETETPAYVSKPAPIARLSFLDISLRDEFYRPIDFQNRDVNLVFEITHLE